MATEIVIVAAGDAPLGRAAFGAASVSPSAWVVAADGGVNLALDLGLAVDLAIGDFDSLGPEQLADLRGSETEIRRFDADKDATDLELALDAALDVATEGCRTVVVGVEGGRPDHALANLALLARPLYAPLEIEIRLARGIAWPVHGQRTLTLEAGAVLSVIPILGDATVSISGVRWPLAQHRIAGGSTLAVSNEAAGGAAVLTVHSGTALLVLPTS